jgi:hypothetical protein
MVSSIVQTQSMLSNPKLDSLPQEEKGAVSSPLSAATPANVVQVAVDTVSTSNQYRQAATTINVASAPLNATSRADPPRRPVTAMNNTPVAVDTVNISDQSRQAATDVKKDAAPIDEMKSPKTKTEDATLLQRDGNRESAAFSKVQFVYDLKGELSVRYMDVANRLIYQVPSELMLSMKEAASKSNASVNTKA